MAVCIACGKEIPEGSKFCNFCGVKQELRCGECGTVLPEGSKFCNMCGAKIGGAQEEERIPPIPNFDGIDFSQFKPDTPVERDVPTLSKYENKQYAVYGYPPVRDNKLEVRVRFNDDYMDDTDPMNHLLADMSFKNNETGEYVEGLDCLQAYVLVDHGIYYARRGKVEFLNANTGLVEHIADLDKVIEMRYVNFMLEVDVYTGMTQIAWSEHRDKCGYMYESWYDIYEIDTRTYRF